MSLPRISPYVLDTETATRGNRTRWTLEPHRAVVLVHDMQRYFVDAFDRTERGAQINVAVENTARLVTRARSCGIPVVYTAQPPDQSPDDRGLLLDFWGRGLTDDGRQAIIGELAPQPCDVMLTKWRYSAFARTDLRKRMRAQRRDQLVITGVYAHIGCLATAMSAFMEDVQAFLVADATADFSETEHRRALAYAASRCAHVVAAHRVLADLGAAARTESLVAR